MEWSANRHDPLPYEGDIIDNHLNQEAAKARGQQLESILAHTREGFVVVQGAGVIRYANPRAGELMGDSPEQLIGQDLGFPIPSPTGATLELPLSADERRSVEMYAVQAEWAGDPVWLLHLQDITDRMVAERALKENEDRFERTNQVSRVGGWETDLSTGELRWTAVTRDILEVDRAEPAPPLDEALPRFYKGASYQRVRRNLQHAIDHGVAADFETHENGEITHYASILTDLSRIKQAEQQLEYLAYHDPLTGLPNRRLFEDRLEQALLQGGRTGETLAVLLLDLDDFKAVNDGFGHEMGDEVLKAVGPRIQGALREGDTVARWGGDELVLLVRNPGDVSAISSLAERALATLDSPFVIGSQEFRLTATIGIAIGGTSEQFASALIMQADGAMYRAKNIGQRFTFFSDEVGRAARERMYMGAELARALEQEQLTIHYQPQVDLRSGQCLGLEALIRWHHPDEGWISPARFIPVAERGGLIHKLGEWVLERACLQASQWLAAGWDFGRLAVNIAAPQLSSNGLIDQIDRVLSQTGLSPTRLELEVTESSLVESSSFVFKTLEALRDRRIHVAIDDFGTGYSSLRYLKDLPVDRLKIDRSFVDGIPEDQKAQTLVQAIIALGSRLGFEVLAEGIETRAQLEELIQGGCVAGQGYLFAKPLDPEAIWELQFPLVRTRDLSRFHGQLG